MVYFTNYDGRIAKIQTVLRNNGIKDLEEAEKICRDFGLDVFDMVKRVQAISFDDAGWAYCVGAAMAIRREVSSADDISLVLGEGLQSFCLPGSVSDERQIGIGHGRLAAMVLRDNVQCFAFLAGHESFAAAEGAIGIARSANKVRKTPLRVILNGLGKDAAEIISRINGFTYVVGPEKVSLGRQYGIDAAIRRNVSASQRMKKKILAASRASFARIRRKLCPAALRRTLTQSPSLPRR